MTEPHSLLTGSNIVNVIKLSIRKKNPVISVRPIKVTNFSKIFITIFVQTWYCLIVKMFNQIVSLNYVISVSSGIFPTSHKIES